MINVDGGGDRPATVGEAHIPDAMSRRLEALAKRLAIEQKVRHSKSVDTFLLMVSVLLCALHLVTIVMGCSLIRKVLEIWKCLGFSPEVREMSGKICCRGKTVCC